VTGQPLIITQNGKAAGVLLSPAAFDELTERARLAAAVEEGLADSLAGRVTDHARRPSGGCRTPSRKPPASCRPRP